MYEVHYREPQFVRLTTVDRHRLMVARHWIVSCEELLDRRLTRVRVIGDGGVQCYDVEQSFDSIEKELA